MTPPRMRTIAGAAAVLREIDPDTTVTPYRIRAWVLDGTLPHIRAGTKRLVNVDYVLTMLAGDTTPKATDPPSGIRRVDVR